jgi:hypothetical protein
MAIVLGSKLVKDTVTYNDYAIGITLPIQITNTAFNQSFTTREQVSSNIKNLLLTKKGERLMQPEFGSGLQEILFEPIDEDTQLRIENEIEKTMSRWLPYIAIDEINVDISDNLRDNNTINVSLSFSVADNMDTDTVTFSLNG